MVVLLVARPLVLGEDPALSSSFSDTGTLVLSLLAMCAATAWAAWRFWTKQSRWYAGFVEVGLAVVVVAAFASVNVAANKHAAWLTSWEWFVLLVGFTTLRQLAVDPAEQRGFLAALLATAVALSFHAWFQAGVELPAIAERLKKGNPDNLDERTREAIRQRAEDGHVFGSYAHPNSFAGYLVLFLPAVFGAAWLARHQNLPYASRMLLLTGAIISAGALYLTHSRGAMLGLLAAGGLVGVVVGWRWLMANPVYLLVLLLGVVGGGYLLVQAGSRGVGKTADTAAYRLDYWSATARMLRDHPFQGVGAGNFGGAYPRYMAPEALEKVKDPHNLFLEQWATMGLLGLAGLLIVLGAFAWHQRRLLVEPAKLLEPDPAPPPTPGQPPVRWEFYVGGAIGLVMAFVLRAVGRESAEIVNEAMIAGSRSVVWFFAFALLERVAWPPRLRSLLLTVGILALLANLLVSGGVGYPSVFGMMLAAMALALNAPLPRRLAVADEYANVSTTAPLPVMFGLLMAYLIGLFYPTTYATTLTQDANQVGRALLEDRFRPADKRQIQPSPEELEGGLLAWQYRFLDQNVLAPLLEAHRLDSWNPLIPAHIANWLGQQWLLTPNDKDLARKAIAWAMKAQQLDPAGWSGYQTEVNLRDLFAARVEQEGLRQFGAPGLALGPAFSLALREPAVRAEVLKLTPTLPAKLRDDVREEHRQAAGALKRLQEYDPTDAPLAYAVAQHYAAAGDPKSLEAAARKAVELQEKARKRPQGLSDQQRLQLDRWLGREPAP